MDRYLKAGFAGLVLLQTAHSIEEYLTRLWEVFPPAAYVSGLVSSNPETGFIIINASLNLIGYMCLFFLVIPNRAGAYAALYFWMAIETANAIVHSVWAMSAGQYVSGAITAPFFAPIVIYLILRLRQNKEA